jgi:mRNA-degrading endonuclease RelE of RelBE toxin-antitoxin system
MSFRITPTPLFEKELKHLARKYPSIKKDLAELAGKLKQEPRMGTPLGNDCYKIRMAISSKGKGKSGGARIITNVWISGTTIYLLSIYDKSEAENISDKDLLERLKNIERK